MFKAPFSLQGRIRRSEYCISYIIYFILYFIIFGCIGLSVREQEHDIGDTGARILESSMLMLIFSLVMCFFMVPQGVKRCHDLGKSGWYLFVPIFNPFWILTEPSVGSIWPKMIWNKVDLPAPLGPVKPMRSPGKMLKETFSNSMRSSKFLDKLLIVIISKALLPLWLKFSIVL